LRKQAAAKQGTSRETCKRRSIAMGAPHRSRPCGLRRVSRRNLAPDAAGRGTPIRRDMVAGLRPATPNARLRPRGAHLRAFRVCQGRRRGVSVKANERGIRGTNLNGMAQIRRHRRTMRDVRRSRMVARVSLNRKNPHWKSYARDENEICGLRSLRDALV